MLFHFRPSSSGKSFLTLKTRSDNEPTYSEVSWHASIDSWWPLFRYVSCVAEHLHICAPLTRGRTHAWFRGPSARCGLVVSCSCSLVVASYIHAQHCTWRGLGTVWVSPLITLQTSGARIRLGSGSCPGSEARIWWSRSEPRIRGLLNPSLGSEPRTVASDPGLGSQHFGAIGLS